MDEWVKQGLGTPEGRLLPRAGCTTVGSQERFGWRSKITLERTMVLAVPLRQSKVKRSYVYDKLEAKCCRVGTPDNQIVMFWWLTLH